MSNLKTTVSFILWIKSAENAARMEGTKNAYKILVGNPKEKRPFERWEI
jgi:hypothetical protein